MYNLAVPRPIVEKIVALKRPLLEKSRKSLESRIVSAGPAPSDKRV
jgi:hypothetical protein